MDAALALVRLGQLRREALAEAESIVGTTGAGIAAVLDRLGLVSQSVWAETVAECAGLRFVRLEDLPETLPDGERLSITFQEETASVLVELSADRAVIVTADPWNPDLIKGARLALRRPVELRVAPQRDVEAALARQRAQRMEGSGDTAALRTIDPGNADQLIELANDAPTIRFVDGIFASAVEKKATDIHLEPFESHARLRLRIDGLLVEDRQVPSALFPGVLSRLKILAGLDIGERRLPQDGRIRHRAQGEKIDIRVSTVPTVTGESMALRLLDLKQNAGSLDALEMPPDVLDAYRWGLTQRSGLVIVTGPTGSGKTTTLHALLSEMNDQSRKIVTVENPVEIRIPGVVQVEANPEIGLTFASVLRTFLRQDPDVIMVGEIRDLETARVAIQAALTGHIVFSTLHTNDAATAVPRLIDMGVEPYLVEAVLKLAGAQRLVRRLCRHCAAPLAPGHPHQAVAERAAARLPSRDVWRLKTARGCPGCNNTGYAGRRAVFEALDADAVKAVARGEPSPARSLFHNGLALAVAGETTVDEVLRVLETGVS